MPADHRISGKDRPPHPKPSLTEAQLVALAGARQDLAGVGGRGAALEASLIAALCRGKQALRAKACALVRQTDWGGLAVALETDEAATRALGEGQCEPNAPRQLLEPVEGAGDRPLMLWVLGEEVFSDEDRLFFRRLPERSATGLNRPMRRSAMRPRVKPNAAIWQSSIGRSST